LRERRVDLEARNAVVLVVGFEGGRRLHGYCRGLKLVDWPCLVDEDLAAYHSYGLGRLPWWRTFDPASIWGYIRFWRQGKAMPHPRGDIRQAGGDFVVDPVGRIALAHPGRDPHDRPSVERILAAIDQGTPASVESSKDD
jgi:AhpC/TSA antioxidant enzyme